MRAALCALLLAFTMACGGDDGGSTSPPPPGGGGSNQDVCAAVRAEAIEPERTAALAPPSSKRGRLDPSPRWRVLDSLWIHQQAADRRAAISSLGPREASTSDIGDIAVIRDEGDVIVPANAFDLKGVGLRFTRNPSGGYDVRLSDAAFRTAIGTRLTLSDDDTARADVAVLVSILLGQRAHRVRELGRQHHVRRRGQRQHRPQRRAPADRAPASGAVPGRSRSERRRHASSSTPPAISTPSPGARSAGSTLPRPRLRRRRCCRTATIEMEFAAGITLPDAVVGLSPGQTARFPDRRI